jgi:hypothetical protein
MFAEVFTKTTACGSSITCRLLIAVIFRICIRSDPDNFPGSIAWRFRITHLKLVPARSCLKVLSMEKDLSYKLKVALILESGNLT